MRSIYLIAANPTPEGLADGFSDTYVTTARERYGGMTVSSEILGYYYDNQIRLSRTPETTNYFDHYGHPVTYAELVAMASDIHQRGLYRYTVEYKCPCCASWVPYEHLGMVIGDLSAEDHDVMVVSAREELVSLRQESFGA